MSRPRRWCSPPPGTNRDHDVALAPRPRRRRRRASCCWPSCVGRPAAAAPTPRSSCSPAASATPTRSAPGGCSRCDSRHRRRRRLRAFVAAGKPVIGICNGFQVLDCARAAARCARRHNAERPLPVRVGARCAPSPPGACIWTADLDADRVPDRPRRGSLRAPRSGRAAPLPGRSPCATPATTPTARSPTSPGCATRAGSCSG